MKILQSIEEYRGQERSWLYNGLDVCVTLEVYQELEKQLKDSPQNVQDTYQHSLNMYGPALEMTYRGFRIDPTVHRRATNILQREALKLRANFDALCQGVFNRTINPNSYKQIKEMYDLLKVRAARTNEEALRRLAVNHMYARPFCLFILAIRDRETQLKSLTKPLHNSRIYYKLNVGGTKTRRFSCRRDDLNRGDNQQNVDKRHRKSYIPDSGMTLVNIDLEQADSRNIGATAWQWLNADVYLDACESGDLHTTVAGMTWPHITTRKEANEPFYRQMTYRDSAKRLGHATNFFGSAPEIAARTQVPRQRVTAFQEKYTTNFPEIVALREAVRKKLQIDKSITNLWGVTRYFHDRVEDNKIIKDALGYLGQSNTGYEIDHALLTVFRHFPNCQLLLQVHDSVMFQVPDDALDATLAKMMPMLELHTIIKGRDFFVPLEAEYGKNWGKYDEETNPGGMRTWTS